MIERFSVFHPNYIVDNSIYQGIRNVLGYIKGTLLDLGCGDSPHYNLLKGRVDKYIGLNFFKDEIKEGGHISIIGRGEYLPLKDNSIDTILCTEVLEHTPIPDLLIQEMRRVLRPSGYIILSVPQVWYLHHRPFDYQRFTQFGLEHLIGRNKLEIIKIKTRGHFWITIGQMLNYYIEYSFSALPKKRLSTTYFIHRFIRAIKKYIYVFNNKIFPLLDKLDKAKLDTLGYIALIQKSGN